VKKEARVSVVVGSTLLSALFWLASSTSAQTPPIQQVFHNPKAEVETAVQRLHALVSGPLPMLEGFVEASGESLDHYQRGYYQCVWQVTPDASGGALVRVTAKITAWYSDADPARSGYRVLPSNGRLESDFLARLGQALADNRAGGAEAPEPARAASSTPTSAARSFELSTSTAPAPGGSSAVPGASPPALSPSPRPDASAVPAKPDADLASLRGRREETEKQVKELKSEVQNLENILHNQTHPNDLVVVRKSGAPVFAKPQTNAHVLFLADAEDEFEMLDRQGSWVHVQIAGLSRGWVRSTQVDLPEGLAGIPNKASVSGPPQDALFRVSREETTVFAGNWQPLRGKTVKVIWVEPSSGKPSSPRMRLDFARSLLLSAYENVSAADQTVAGVVIVFDSADGGQIAATRASLKQWQAGNLSEASFWQQASLDPPEAFRTQSKP